MLSILKKIFGGTKSEKDIKQIQPQVDKANEMLRTVGLPKLATNK